MQLCLVGGSIELRAWARDLAAGLGFGLGESVPLADPTFLGLLAQALWPEVEADPAVWVSAAELIERELGSEVTADERSLAAAALALEVAFEAARALAGRSGPGAWLLLETVWSRTADRLGASSPHRPADQRRIVAQALGDLQPTTANDLPLAA